MAPPNTFNPSNLPATLPQKPAGSPASQSTTPSAGSGLSDDIIQKMHSKAKAAKQDIYQKYFGRNFGAGKATTLKSFGGGLLGGKLHKGLKTTLKAFKRSGSGSGMNLSSKDIEHIGDKIGGALKKLSTSKAYDTKEEHIPLKKKRELIRGFKQDVKAGKLSSADLEDAKQIVENIQI